MIIYLKIRTRTTLEFIGTCEEMYNPGFKVVEFDHVRMKKNLNMAYSPQLKIEYGKK